MHLLTKAVRCAADFSVIKNKEEKFAVAEIREFVGEQYAEKNVLELVANEFGKTMDDIGAVFKNAYGISIEEYISRRRYNAAKELLRFSVKPMEEVAMESGIGDLISMQQMFIQNDGMSADEYRRKWAGWIRG